MQAHTFCGLCCLTTIQAAETAKSVFSVVNAREN